MKAIHTQETTDKGYKGVSPNFGGGLTKDGEGIGKTPKKMKKLTTVFSKKSETTLVQCSGFDEEI